MEVIDVSIFRAGFGIFGGLFVLVVFGIFVLIGFMLIKSFTDRTRNNGSPVVTSRVTVTAKTMNTAYRGNYIPDNISVQTPYNTYFITFEFANGNRAEFTVPRTDYAYISEHDAGVLTYQGSRYINFERDINN
jgi:hypothetical protein